MKCVYRLYENPLKRSLLSGKIFVEKSTNNDIRTTMFHCYIPMYVSECVCVSCLARLLLATPAIMSDETKNI